MPLSKLLSLFRPTASEPDRSAPAVPVVAFDAGRVTVPIKADILSTLKGYADIPKGKLAAIKEAAVAAVERGGDLHMLHSAIMLSGIPGMTKVRAGDIARHVQGRATSLMDVERMAGLGVEEAVWSYSGAPCYVRTKAPSAAQLALDADHKAANGRRYRLREGLTIGGKPTWPGREAGCKCVPRAVIAGFS